MHRPHWDWRPAGSVVPKPPASRDAPTLDIDINQADDSESFNLDVSGSSDDADPAPPVHKANKKTKKGPAPASVPLDFEAPPDPLLQMQASQKTATLDDVSYFFQKQKDKDTICVICK
jgi:hypothetical protein